MVLAQLDRTQDKETQTTIKDFYSSSHEIVFNSLCLEQDKLPTTH